VDLAPVAPQTPAWQALFDEQERDVYWLNTATGESQWESPLPAGWTAAWDMTDQGTEVFYVHEGGATQFEFPADDYSEA